MDRAEQGRGGGEAVVARKGGQQAVLVLACCVRPRFGAAAHAIAALDWISVIVGSRSPKVTKLYMLREAVLERLC